jgi:hypothetical protein
MPSQKLPLFNGIIAPVSYGNLNDVPPVPASPVAVATPPDKNLEPRGAQAFYAIHLWLIPGVVAAEDENEFYQLSAFLDSNPTNLVPIWQGKLWETFLGNVYAAPMKILDGYPIRGNVGLVFQAWKTKAGDVNPYPEGAQLFGYYYRVGEGTQIEAERRFIGEPSSDADNVTQGIPIELPANQEKKIVHYFEPNRIDEISLAWSFPPVVSGPFNTTHVGLYFEDENNNPLIPGHVVNIVQFQTNTAPPGLFDPQRNYLRDPKSIYTIYKAVFGGGLTNLGLPQPHHLSMANLAPKNQSIYAHGYFTRR